MRPAALVAVLGAASFAVWAMWQARQFAADAVESAADSGGVAEAAADLVSSVESQFMDEGEYVEHQNVKAFKMLIRSGESSTGPGAYRMIVFGGSFDSWADHPRIYKPTAGGLKTSAAGAFQITATTWDDIQRTLHLPDFSPASQELAATFLIRRRGALADVVAGRWAAAIRKCRKEWTSLPGASEAGYGMARALEVLARYGGVSEGETA